MVALRSFPIIAGILIVFSVASMASWRTWNDYVNTIGTTETLLSNLARSGEEQLNGTLRSIDIFLQEADERLNETPQDSLPKLAEYLSSRAKRIDKLRVIFVTDQNNVITFSTQPSLLGFDGSQRKFIEAVSSDGGSIDADRLHIIGPFVAQTGVKVIAAVRARRDRNGNLLGVIAVTMLPDIFEALTQSIAPNDPPGFATLVSGNLDIIFQSPRGPSDIGRSIKEKGNGIRKHILSGQQNTIQYFTSIINGADRIGAFHTLSRYGTYVIVSMEMTSVLRPFWARSAIHFIMLTLITILVFFLVRRVQSRENELKANQLQLAETNENLEARVEERTSEVRDRETRIQGILDTVVDGIVIIDERGIVETFNPAAAQIFGFRADEVVGNYVEMLMPEPYRSTHDVYIAEYVRTDHTKLSSVVRELVGLRKDGSTFPMDIAISEMWVNGRRKFNGVVRDITARKNIETALIERDKQFKTLINQIDDGFCIVDMVYDSDGHPIDYQFVEINPAFEAQTGLIDAQGRTILEMVPNHDAHWFEVYGNVAKTGEAIRFQNHATAMGRYYDVFAFRINEERQQRVCIIFRDITESHNFTEQLKQSEAMLSAAIENIPGGFLLVAADGHVELFNNNLLQLYPQIIDTIFRGALFKDIIRAGAERGVFLDADGHTDEWVSDRMAKHAQDDAIFEDRLTDGKWVRVAVRRLPNGQKVCIHVDITELVRARNEADQANQAKSDFLSSMSHELRTPLNAILGFAQLLEHSQRDPLNERQLDQVGHILKGGQHLLDLINEVLELARIEAGELSLSMEPVDLGALINDCLSVVAVQAQRNGVSLVPPSFGLAGATVRADSLRLKQILLNLLSNAIKYNRVDGKVTVSVSAVGEERVRVAVDDTGVGIPADKQQDLFKPFNRLGAETSDIEGTGIGLTITQKMVTALGGTLGFTSIPGEGSSFWIEISRERSREPRSAETASSQRGQLHEGSSAGQRTVRMLYVEDNSANVRLIESVADELSNLIVVALPNAELALDVAERDQPDIILLDINLPGINGIEAAQRLKANPKTRDIPLIALSADAMPRTAKAARAAGCLEYLTKPVDVVRLKAAIRMAVESQHD